LGRANEQTQRVINYYEKTAEDYDKEYDVPLYKLLYDKITWRYIQPYLPKEGLVLDAGGGTGKWTIPLAKRGLQVVILDISRHMLDVALRKVKKLGLEDYVTFRQGDICNIDFPKDHFDFVLAEGDPISYCSDPQKAVAELYRVLKPGCYVVAGVDSLFRVIRFVMGIKHDLETAFKILRERRFYSPEFGFHCWAFTPKDLKQLFIKQGFKVVKIIGKPVVFFREAEPLLQSQAEKLLQLELALCEEESIIGYGGHLHIVAKKPVK
jgi:ubiquinone/menaquinone biosynthesis C-methylase UbiE